MANEDRVPVILALVRGLVAEVHRHATPLSVTLDSTFDHLGIGSLELAELLLRVQDKFGVALPPHILASAETPRDLLSAVARGQLAVGKDRVEDRGMVSLPATAPGGITPESASTLNDVLNWHASATPDRTHVRILDDAGGPVDVTLRRARHAAQAVAFAVYTWVVYAALGLSVAVLLLLLPRPQWRWRVARGSIRLLGRLTRIPITVHCLEHLPAATSVVVANHPGWIDPMVLASVLPQSFHFVAAEVLEHQGLNGFVLRRLGHQFVERHEREHGVADADRLAALVRAGRSLVIFPEGRLARAPGLRPFHMGAFVVAADTGAPVVAVAIRGTRTILQPEHHFPRRGAIDIVVGEPIWPSGTV